MTIKDLYVELKYADPGTIKSVIKLMDYYIQQRREMNDVAVIDEVMKNQGAIEIMKELKQSMNIKEKQCLLP